ncbi:TPA: fimbria/pilus periplasmic chaperone [Escherichia coli]|uniref:Periplasmic fimbrial chaperone n=1 Tax=Proteus hauseri ATCC 700826 TaxID=1354271 RepID=A0AAJ3HTU0_PROHU|nr:fimbria/pilus periplasmic chaperone [Proteus hauseri]OAT48232.1 periplasmic fimbrial chaperone [Proteus hauseri ATCC 700826]HCH49130.1 molecular chaperone [Proteus sp. (in: enterobacteria)]HDH9217360.1 fimbria/pilus periplasmic chaperone [Escherichia coli]
MILSKRSLIVATTLLAGIAFTSQAMAAIALDRTRVIFNGADKSVSLNVSNQNKELPYLAQGWMENENGERIESPLIVLPPIQRIEPGDKSQVKVQSLPAIAQLPQDRESVFYFNLREIPPRSDKPNVLQIALQTRIKLFYRPASIYATQTDLTNPWQEKITLTKKGDRYEVNNPTPYYVTLVDGLTALKGQSLDGFQPLMIAPKSTGTLNLNAAVFGASPVLSYINDYGGRPQLKFSCNGNECKVTETSAGN